MATRGKSRREILLLGTTCGRAAFLLDAAQSPQIAAAEPAKAAAADKKKEEIVSPAEDLMREHGVLNRILLIYEEVGRRLHDKQDFDFQILLQTSQLVRRFVEDYHERLEEKYLFPRLKEAHKLVDLVDVLLAQHEAGRKLTDRIGGLTKPMGKMTDADRQALGAVLHEFVRMYRPHEAREDTILFPAFREIVPSETYWALGEEFEDKEHELFGEEGFERNVEQVAQLEKKLGIYDLGQFTPKLQEK